MFKKDEAQAIAQWFYESYRSSQQEFFVFTRKRKKPQMDGASKAHVQQSVAARSSALRQAKLVDMRSRNGNNQFPAVVGSLTSESYCLTVGQDCVTI
ncbi:hypothetical protein SUGI_1006820 [Cryptomeria japonica]|nr:hypothetical protein SUGI_1006820 [Cryptomeria japonica]